MIGNWDYTFLEPVPAAANSLRRMEDLLTGPLCGWPPDRVTVIANEPGPGNIPDRLVTAHAGVHDVALFYFVGHGQIAPDDELCLGMRDSRPEANRRASTSLRFGDVRSALMESRAATKIVILDCCYAGLVTTRTLGASDVLDHAQVAGAYTMAATRAYTTARYEQAQGRARPQTYFTKYLADVVERGIPGQPARLRLEPLFKQVRDNLAADHRPVPESRAVDNAREFVFAYNAAPPGTRLDTERELAERDAQVAALLDQVAAHERELARLRSRQAESPSATAERREELREAIHEAEREAGEAVRQLDQARDAQAAAAPVPSFGGPAPGPAPGRAPRGVLRGVAIRATLVTVLLGGAIAWALIALSGGNKPGLTGNGNHATATGGSHPPATGSGHPTATGGGHPTASGGATNGNPANIVTVLASQWKSIPFGQPPDSVAFAPDGTTLAVGTSQVGDTPGGNAYLVNTGTSVKTKLPNPLYLEGVTAVAFTQDGTLSISVGTNDDGTSYSWNVANHRVEFDYPDPRNGIVTAMAGAPEGEIAVIEDSTDIYLWNPATDGIIPSLYQDPSKQGISAIAMSSDDGTLVTADGDRTVYLWHTGNMGAGPVKDISLLNTSVTALAVGPGGNTVAISGGGGSTYLWNPSNDKRTAVTGPPLNTMVNSMAFSPDGALLAIGDSNGTTYMWAVATGKPLPAINDPSVGGAAAVAFGPNGTTLATAYSNGFVYLWRLTIMTG
ncbi:MAG TPA: caspase family protein [Streptosporangiaceae bacterium]